MIDHYDWAGGREAMLRFGPGEGPVVMVALPLFEEHNRTRALAVSVLHLLAVRDIAGALPDLPAQGESLMPTASCSLADLRAGFAAAAAHVAPRPVYAASIRSGALTVDSDIAGHWQLAPQDGNGLGRDLARLAAMGKGPSDGTIAGNAISADFLTALDGVMPSSIAPQRTVRLTSDPADADARIDGPPLWRRAEPGNDPIFAERIAADIADWIARCDG